MTNLNRITLLVILSALSLGGMHASAGVSTSGGGFAVVCRAPNGQIRTAELLDLYEAHAKFNFTLQKPSGDYLMDHKAGITHATKIMGERHGMAPLTKDGYLQYMAYLSEATMKMAQFTAPDEKLPILHDIGKSAPLPDGCKLEPLAVFDNSETTLKIDSEIWSAIDSLNKAALIEHEIHYLGERVDGEHPTSESTRLHVAHMFVTDNSVKPTDADLPAKDVQFCSSAHGPESQSGFYLYPSKVKPSHQTFQFSYLADTQLLALATIELSNPVSETFSAEIPLISTYSLDWSIQVRKVAPESYEVRLLENGQVKKTSQASCTPAS